MKDEEEKFISFSKFGRGLENTMMKNKLKMLSQRLKIAKDESYIVVP